MLKYIIKRILLMIPVLLGVIIVVFTLNYMSPSDPVNIIAGATAPDSIKEEIRVELGLDQPYHVQLFNYIKGVVTKLDFGKSYITKTDVREDILSRFPTTLKLSLLMITFGSVIGILLGVISATKQNSLFDYIGTFLALVGASLPGFWLSLMLIIVFSLRLGWFPPSDIDTWKGWVLPVVAGGIFPIASIMRTTRANMLEVIRQDYIRTARSKGLSERTVIMRHALSNAIIPVVTIIGMALGGTMGGTMVLEAVFSIPGIGSYMKQGIGQKDTPVIMGCVLFAAFLMSAMNLLVDILYAYIDPRIKAQYAGKKKTKKSAAENVSEQEAAAVTVGAEASADVAVTTKEEGGSEDGGK